MMWLKNLVSVIGQRGKRFVVAELFYETLQHASKVELVLKERRQEMNNLNVVWSAVVASVASALAVVLAIWGDPDVSIAFGAVAIASAVLSIREKS
jgi:hypothetical protein